MLESQLKMSHFLIFETLRSPKVVQKLPKIRLKIGQKIAKSFKNYEYVAAIFKHRVRSYFRGCFICAT